MKYLSINFSSLLFVISLSFITSCKLSNKNSSKKEQEVNSDTCRFKNYKLYLNEYSVKQFDSLFYNEIKNSSDECVLNIIDSVTINYKIMPNTKAFAFLNSISCRFDGYITEYFVDVFEMLFKAKSSRILNHMYDVSLNNSASCFYEFTKLYLKMYDNEGVIKKLILKERMTQADIKYKAFLNSLLQENGTKPN